MGCLAGIAASSGPWMQARGFARVAEQSAEPEIGTSARPVTAAEAGSLVPGLTESSLPEDAETAGLLIEGGLVLDPAGYLRCRT